MLPLALLAALCGQMEHVSMRSEPSLMMRGGASPVLADYQFATCGTTATGTRGEPVTCSRNPATVATYECNGTLYTAQANQCRVDSSGGVTGIVSEPAGQNYVASCDDASTWTDVSTPTTTLNTWSGPRGVQTGDTIEDTSAASTQGKVVARLISGTLTGPFTVSCYAKAGTHAGAQLQVASNGTGTTSCPFALTTSGARYSCTATIGGAPTNVEGRVFVGTTSGAVGSIDVTDCQFEASPTVTSLIVTTGTAASRGADAISVGNPQQTPGVFTVGWAGTAATWGVEQRVLVSAGAGSGANAWFIDDAGAKVNSKVYSLDGTVRVTSLTSTSGYLPGSLHRLAFSLNQAAVPPASIIADGVSLTGGTDMANWQNALKTPLYLGSRGGSAFHTSGKIQRFKVCRGSNPARCQP